MKHPAAEAIEQGTLRRVERDDEITAVTKVYEQTGDKLNESQEAIRGIAKLAERLRKLVEGDKCDDDEEEDSGEQ